MLTLSAGNRKLLLRLNRRRWPTSLALQTRALVRCRPFPSTPARGETVTTGLSVLPRSSR